MAYGSKLAQKFYYSMPYFMRVVLASAYGYRQRHDRYGDSFYQELDFLRKSQYWSNSELFQFQREKTELFLKKALKDTKFYRENSEYGFENAGDIHKYPILSKQIVREQSKALISDNLKNIPHRWAHTSGTTGRALVFPLSSFCFQREYAFRAMHYEWSGISLHKRDPIAFCAGHPVAHQDRNKPPFWIYDRANNWLLFSSYHLTEKNLQYYIKELEKFQPVMIHGYPSSIYLMALAYKKYGSGKLKLKSVYTSSETLLDFQRVTIENAFQTKVYNWYGTSEMCANIVECDHGILHLKIEHSLVEILDENNNPCNPGESGRLVCTEFANDAFPLIRYDVGDIATLSTKETCPCGRGGILIENVIGRIEDYVVTPDGRLVGRLDHIFKDSLNVVEAQIIQTDPSEIILRIVRESGYSQKDERAILNEARLRLGQNIQISFDFVDKIERTKNGKFRFVLSSLDQRSLLQKIQ